MKKIFVFSVLIIALCGSCFAQNVNNERRIIGTWVDQRGNTWVFNTNGILLNTPSGKTTKEYKYGVTDTKLAIYSTEDSSWGGGGMVDGYYPFVLIFDISISSDGKTLILTDIEDSVSTGLWFTKK